MRFFISYLLIACICFFGCGQKDPVSPSKNASLSSVQNSDDLDLATLGAGCYWCIEAVLLQIDGVESVESGFMGGHVVNPSYEDVCSKKSGHIEVVQVRFDASKLPYEHLLAWFWKLHDPTSWDKQGGDSGPQYRSAIFYHSDAQRDTALASLKAAEKELDAKVVTEVRQLAVFYPAESQHQNYYERNKSRGYCRFVIAPKLEKLGLKK